MQKVKKNIVEFIRFLKKTKTDIVNQPVDTRRRFNVDTTSSDVKFNKTNKFITNKIY